VSTLWLGLIGFLDDYIKVFKKNKEGLAGKFKVLGQIGLGIIVGLTLYFSDDVVVRQYIFTDGSTSAVNATSKWVDIKSMITTIPFRNNNELDYCNLFSFAGPLFAGWSCYLYIPFVILVITA